MTQVRSVSIGVWLTRGSRHETAERGGIAHFVEHMLFKGTASRSAEDIAQQIDSIGGQLDAFTAKEYASYYIKVLDEHLPLALDILSDIVLNPAFKPEDVEREKKVVVEEIKMVEDTPDDLVHELFVMTFWPDHPLGRPILGTEETVRRLGREQILAHYAETFHPSNMIFCASGNVRPEDVVPFLEKTFGGDSVPPSARDWPEPSPTQHVLLREKRELEQVHLCLGSKGFPQQGDERYATASRSISVETPGAFRLPMSVSDSVSGSTTLCATLRMSSSVTASTCAMISSGENCWPK